MFHNHLANLPANRRRRTQPRSFRLEVLEDRRLLAFTPQLVADVNTVGADSVPNNFVAAAGTTFFHTSHFGHGKELWKTDGTSEGTQRVKQIEPHGDANIRGMIEYDDKLYFFAEDGINGTELWVSDGTEEGTKLVKDIFAGPESSNGRPQNNSFPNFAVANGKLFFSAHDPEHGMELWQSDGSTEGTQLVADINPVGNSSPTSLRALGDKIVFLADDGTHGIEIWSTDGTTAGTTMVTDFESQPYQQPSGLTPVGNILFFKAPNAEYGNELWKTDGTSEGTMLVKDINPGPGSAYPTSLTNWNGTLIFGASTADGYGVFRSDGTEAGTSFLRGPFIAADTFTVAGDKVYFIGRDATADGGEIGGHELWVTDGTADGTRQVADINPGPNTGLPFRQGMAVLGDHIYFTGLTTETGEELWVSDGTADGTRMLKDINPGPSRGMLYFGSESITAIGDKLYFGASDGVAGVEPWVSDGTTAGTKLLNDVALGTSPSNPTLWTALGDLAVFGANDGVHGLEPWKTDGTLAGTSIVKDILAGQNHSFITWSFGKAFAGLDGNLFFTARDAESPANGLWRTDGTEAGTTLVPSTINSPYAPQLFTHSAGQLFFKASDEGGNTELWKSDGTETGTMLVKDIFPGSSTFPGYGSYVNPSAPGDLVDAQGKLYFSATNENGRELWTSDGTEVGTIQVTDLNPGTHDYYGIALGNGSYPRNITPLADGQLFFVASEPEHGRELWTSDGTAAGTRLVKDIMPGGGDVGVIGIFGGEGGAAPNSSDPLGLTVLNDKLYFYANDGVHGRELWESDGTEAGTRMVRDVNPGIESLIPENARYPLLTAAGGKLFFFADNGSSGTELWVSDGSEVGTKLVRDINPGPDGSSDPFVNPFFVGIVPVGDGVAFRANDGVHGNELWTSDGTEEGTAMVGDIRPGPLGSYPYGIANVNGTLYFGADDGLHGREPWKLAETVQPPVVGDSNHDGIFNSMDLVLVFQIGEYEDAIGGNSTYEDGDWNGDGDFDSADLMFAFQAGTYITNR